MREEHRKTVFGSSMRLSPLIPELSRFSLLLTRTYLISIPPSNLNSAHKPRPFSTCPPHLNTEFKLHCIEPVKKFMKTTSSHGNPIAPFEPRVRPQAEPEAVAAQIQQRSSDRLIVIVKILQRFNSAFGCAAGDVLERGGRAVGVEGYDAGCPTEYGCFADIGIRRHCTVGCLDGILTHRKS